MTGHIVPRASGWKLPTTSFPAPKTLAWVAESLSSGAKVVGGRRLTGGIVSSVHRLSVEDETGTRHQVVLRRYLEADRVARNAELIRREAKVLQSLSMTDLPAPTLIATDPDGFSAGVPSLLMRKLPGRVYLTPREPESWLSQMAAQLALIHSTKVSVLSEPHTSYSREREWEHWAPRPELWKEAYDVSSNHTASETAFIHGDFQHFNQLWSRDKLTGIIDWGSGRIGNPDEDVGHCRLNLAVLFSVDWAEQFRLHYERRAGRSVNPLADLSELLKYSPDWQRFIPVQVAGRTSVDVLGMTARVEGLIESALRRL